MTPTSPEPPPKTSHKVSTAAQQRFQLDAPALTGQPSLLSWAELYLQTSVIGVQAENTHQAKLRDLRDFMTFFAKLNSHLLIEQWFARDTRAFLNHLEQAGRAPSSINRVFSTLRHFARWVHAQPESPLALAGLPTTGIKELAIDEPDAKKLDSREIYQLLKAADALVLTQRRSNSRPKRNRAILVLLLHTGLRVSELVRLKLNQWDGKRFHNVRRKGNVRTKLLYVRKAGRELLQAYLDDERPLDASQPTRDYLLLPTTGSGPMNRRQVNHLLRRIADEANKHHGAIRLHPHRLRHTFGYHVRQLTKSDSETARLLGHQSNKYAGRYSRNTQAEREALLESSGGLGLAQ